MTNIPKKITITSNDINITNRFLWIEKTMNIEIKTNKNFLKSKYLFKILIDNLQLFIQSVKKNLY